MSNRDCIMGCRLEKGQARHGFPKNPKRRAEWCRILGIYPRTKKICICSAHFSNCYFLGNRLSQYAVPNPPESKQTDPQIMDFSNSMFYGIPNNQINEDSYTYRKPTPKKMAYSTTVNEPIKVFPQLVKEEEPNYEETEITEPAIFNENVIEDPLLDSENFPFSLKDEDEATSQESEGKVEDFEIRKGSNNDMIIKGRYVQTKDYLVVTYTPPRKWTLQQQVQMLDRTCEQQLRQIRQLNRDKYRLQNELKKHEMLLPQLRKMQQKNRYFYYQLKMYKQKEALLKKRRKERRLKTVTVKEQDDNVIDSEFGSDN
ncbi:uncharacterized protein LOC135954305 [Calliphora vicina]|uniref:uncharacterized protein LOC135954305 n=1 Tax=Calliphora vicina TaxID=7373 RepID=UPI00325ABDFC